MHQITDLAVETRNRTNAKTMAVQADVIALLKPYIDKKVRKVSGYGGWVAALNPQLDALYESLKAEGFICWVGCCVSWLNLSVQTTYPVMELVGGGHAVEYAKQETSIGKIDGSGILLALSEPVKLRTDYTAAWVEQTRADAYRLESEARELRSSLRDFDR